MFRSSVSDALRRELRSATLRAAAAPRGRGEVSEVLLRFRRAGAAAGETLALRFGGSRNGTSPVFRSQIAAGRENDRMTRKA